MSMLIEDFQGERTRCEVWTRVMGYYRPIDWANPGKQKEHEDRLLYKEPDWMNDPTAPEPAQPQE